VHADLSEYNILYHNSQLYIIDVGQSVEHDHPSAFDFLRSDLKNVEEFFGRRNVQCVGLRQAFEFIIGEGIDEGEEEPWLRRLIAEGGEGNTSENEEHLENQSQGHEKQSDDKVFMQSYIPRTLNQVFDPERDVDIVSRGTGQNLIYSDIIGVVGASEGLQRVRIGEGVESLSRDEKRSESATDSEEDDQDENFKERQPRGHRNEDKEAKKVELFH
jgi:RIO kinase 1